MRRGFTLIELAVVLAIIATFAALASAGLQPMLLRSRAAEAPALLESIVHAELAHFRAHGRYLACAPSADAPPRGTIGTFDATRAGWKQLGIAPDGGVRFTYEVVLDGATFKAIARGDLDGDGEPSTYVQRGDTLAVATEGELE